MKKNIIIFDVLQNGEELYKYIKNNFSNKNINIKFVPHKKPSESKIGKIKDLLREIKYIGVFDFIKYLITKNCTVVVGGNIYKYKFISNNIISLNHGWGTKKSPGNLEAENEEILDRYRKFIDINPKIVCLSEFDKTYYLRHEKLKELGNDNFIPLGMARNDYLLNNKDNKDIRKKILNKLGIEESNQKIFLYSPTHREYKDKNDELCKRIIEEFKQIDEKLSEKNYILLFRPHYYNMKMKDSLEGLKNIYYVGFEEYPDPRDLMISSDCLISDYSSIFVDYLLLDKPIVFYVFDLNEYSKYRGVVIDYNNNIHSPGEKITKLEQITDLNYDRRDLLSNVSESKQFFHKYTDNNSTKRIAEFITQS